MEPATNREGRACPCNRVSLPERVQELLSRENVTRCLLTGQSATPWAKAQDTPKGPRRHQFGWGQATHGPGTEGTKLQRPVTVFAQACGLGSRGKSKDKHAP